MAVKAVKKEPAKAAEPEAAPAPKKGKGKLIIIILSALLLAGGGGAYWYLHQASGPQEAKPHAAKPPLFLPLDPFTVNLQLEDSAQFLQTALTLKVAGDEAADTIKGRMPEVRNAVLLLLSSRKSSEILTVEGKRKLGNDIVSAVNAIFNPASRRPAKVIRPAPPPGETAAEPAAEPAAAPPEEATPAVVEEKPRALVLDVLFTSFIVQ